MRVTFIVFLAGSAGLIGAVTTTSDSNFVRAFCFVFWFVGVAAFLAIARLGSGRRHGSSGQDIRPVDPWVDADGVRHFPGDVFDIENHPRPGAHGNF